MLRVPGGRDLPTLVAGLGLEAPEGPRESDGVTEALPNDAECALTRPLAVPTVAIDPPDSLALD